MAHYIDIVIPTDQREGTESKIGRWLKREGDSVAEHEPLIEIHTDKVTLEVAAPKAGILLKILKQEGEEIDLTEPLGRIEIVEGPATSAPIVPKRETQGARAASASEELSPAVRSLSKELGVDPGALKGSGKDGRVTARDVESAAARLVHSDSKSTKRPHSPMRKNIAARMSESVSTAPHVTSVFEADFTAVMTDKIDRSKEFKAAGVKLTISAYLVRAAATALRAVPDVNSRYHDEYLELFEEIHIGLATAIDDPQGHGAGLVVPVIRNADELSLLEIASEIERLTELARAGKLQSRDLSGATFSISNHGVSGSLFAAPIIIPQPQSAILGVGKLEKRAFVVDDDGIENVIIRPAAFITLTIDHRALDGFTANKFLTAFVSELR